MIREKIMRWLIEESKEDLLSLPWIISYGARDTGKYEEGEDELLAPLPINDPIEIKRKTLILVRDLLNTKILEAGQLADGGTTIDPWRIPVDDVVARIERKWTALGKQPDMTHDIVWLGPCLPENWPHAPR